MFMKRVEGWLAVAAGLLMGLSAAEAGQDAGVRISPFYGSFGTSIEIKVPSYHGVQPVVALQYDSNAPNGFAGMGWTLQADSAIERSGYRGTLPQWNASDGFVLDGMELVPCTSLGGTHCTKRQSYLRIVQDAPNNRWVVTDRDGMQAIYTPVINTWSGTFRWAIASRTDASGAHVVNFSYQCYPPVDPTQCYLDTINYNGNEVRFFRESRTDAVPSARNLPALGLTNFRLKSISVRVGGALARAYKVLYTTSSSSDRSLIYSVQECGRWSTVDTNTGAVGCVTPMVPTVFDWFHGFGMFHNQGWASTFTPLPDSSDPNPWQATGDFNGDGRTDTVIRMKRVENNEFKYSLAVWYPTASQTFVGALWGPMLPLGEWGSVASTWVGDFDGDGKSDVGARRSDGSVRVWRSTGTTFEDSVWQPAGGAWGAPEYTHVGDANGDGKDDLISMNGTNIHVHLSTGTSFVDLAPVATGPLGGASTTWVADFTGDKRADIATAVGTNVYVKVSTGTSFTSQLWTTYGPSLYFGSEWNRLGDFNGDGYTDLVVISPNGPYPTMTVLLSMGSSFSSQPLPAGGTFGSSGLTFVMDVDADGRSDIVSGSGSTIFVRRSTSAAGVATFTTSNWTVMGGGTFAGQELVMAGDFDADRRPDILAVDLQAPGTIAVWRNLYSSVWFEGGQPWLGGVPDVLRKITTPTLGSTKIEYKPSSAFVNTNNPPILNTTFRTTTWDGRATTTPSVTTYEYGGGLFDRLEDKFLGFRTVRENMPCANGEWLCPYVVSTFHQDYATSGRLERRDLYRGDGALLTAELHTYTTNAGQIPYECQDASTMRYEYLAGTSTYRRTYVSRTHDANGNLSTETEWGDFDVAGDERTTQYVYVPNPTKYLVNLPARTITFEGISTAGAVLKEVMTQFDGNTTWNAPPTSGRPTRILHYDTVTATYVAAEMDYDFWGNVIAQRDHLGRETTFVFDAATHMFAVSTTNAAGMTAVQTFDPVCETITSSTDEGGRTKTTQYDGLCRVIRVDSPGGAYVTTSYMDGGWNLTPDTQYIETRTNPPNAEDGELWKRQYFDGLGRVWREESSGASASSPAIRAESYFDARGNKHMASAPHYASDYGYLAITDFDALNRPVRVVLPDQAVRTMSYAPGEAIAVDELGKQERRRSDGLGREVETAELVGGTWRAVTTTYNLRDDVVGISDPVGNVWAFTHDSLGRRLQSSDPDKGVTTYEYDAASQLRVTHDAMGQRIERYYDVLGRPTSRTTFWGWAVERSVSYIYDEVRAGYSNVGRLTTTMVDWANPVTYDYDAAGHVLKMVRPIDANMYELQRTYDAAGRLSRVLALRNGAFMTSWKFGTMAYDGAGRVKSIAGYVTNATYTAAGALATHTNANGTTVYRMHSASRGWLNNVHTRFDIDGPILQQTSYTRDARGLITGATGDQGATDSWSYSYDDARQLTGVTNVGNSALSQTFTYDAIGNMTFQTGVGAYQYPGVGASRPHAVTQAGANTYAYDANGNMLSGAGRAITWSIENQPLQVNGEIYRYDGDGSRYKVEGPWGTSIHLGDDIEEKNGVVTQYVSLAGVLVAKSVGGARSWLHCDGLGSVRAITDLTGTVVQRVTYAAYTETATSMVSLKDTRLAAGQQRDATGLYYLHARYYDPVLGRFISADPTVPSERVVGLNRYAYAANDPVNNADIDGLGGFFTSLLTNMSTALNWIGQAIYVIKSCITFINNSERYGFWNAVVIKLAESIATLASAAAMVALVTPAAPAIALIAYAVIATALTVIKDTVVGLAQGRTLKEAWGAATQWTNLVMTAASAYGAASGYAKNVDANGRAEAAKSLNPFRDPGPKAGAVPTAVPMEIREAAAGANESAQDFLTKGAKAANSVLGTKMGLSGAKNLSFSVAAWVFDHADKWWAQAAYVAVTLWGKSSGLRDVLNHMDDLVELYTKPQAMVNLSSWSNAQWFGFARGVYSAIR